MSKAPTIAVVGFGYWGRNLVRTFFELGALHTVCDSDDRKAKIVAEQYPGVRFAAHYSSVLSNPEIAAVAISAPAATHHRLVVDALRAGKDVFVEKPMALTVAEGTELNDLAGKEGRILMVGHILRYHPAIQKLTELIDRGELGQIRYIYSNRLNIGKIRTEENILWSFAPHDISVILALLHEEPIAVFCHGSAHVNPGVVDVTNSNFVFPSGVTAHIFVSWLHPFKEQRLVVVGSEKMAVFDDTADHKLILYPHRVEWKMRVPSAVQAPMEKIELTSDEPLRRELEHFLASIQSRRPPLTDGNEGIRVLRVLEACEASLREQHDSRLADAQRHAVVEQSYYAHESAIVDRGCEIGVGTKIWHFCHILTGAKIGKSCILGQNCCVASGVEIGDRVKIQNNVSVYTGTTIEDDVFLGPSCVLTNVTNPRSQVNRHALYEPTLIRRGATIGANATVVCGVTIGQYSFVGAGAVVTRDVADYALVVGNPARRVGWMSRHGHRLNVRESDGVMTCPESGFRYAEIAPGVVRCLDYDESAPLPENLAVGTRDYRDFKNVSDS